MLEEENAVNSHLIHQIDRPILFAHRGSSAHAPENTIAAFQLAFEQGCSAFELDTMLSKDGRMVVIHDRDVSRTTDGKGKVDELPANEILIMDAGKWFHKKYSGQKVPLLEQVLEIFGKKMLINIELKNYHSPIDPLASMVAELIKDMGLEKNVVISSFLPGNLGKVRKILKYIPVALLTPRGLTGVLFRSFVYRSLSKEFIHPDFRDVNKEYINKEHQRARRVHAYTVNDEANLSTLIRWGIDGYFCDDPLMAQNVLNQVKSSG